jgi:hypothetical protein
LIIVLFAADEKLRVFSNLSFSARRTHCRLNSLVSNSLNHGKIRLLKWKENKKATASTMAHYFTTNTTKIKMKSSQHLAVTLISSLILCISQILPSHGFLFPHAPKTSSSPSSSSSSSSSSQLAAVGNWISGVTNTPPSQPLLTKELETSLVSKTSLQNVELECVYKGSSNGWSAVDFHKCVDGKGSGLVVALTRSGQLFGGFNPAGWRSTDDYYNSNSAFLWFDGNGKAVKCPVLPGGE